MSEEKPSAAPPAENKEPGEAGPGEDPIVQYIILREDLRSKMSWPTGSLIAQGAHASVAAIWETQADPHTSAYLADLANMRKVVLAAKSETQLRNIATSLAETGIAHKLWVEQPENFATCIATKPCPKSSFGRVLRKLKLFK